LNSGEQEFRSGLSPERDKTERFDIFSDSDNDSDFSIKTADFEEEAAALRKNWQDLEKEKNDEKFDFSEIQKNLEEKSKN